MPAIPWRISLKIHVTIPDPIGAAIKTVVGLSLSNEPHYPDLATADAVIVGSKRELERFYNDKQRFLIISSRDPGRLPKNVVWVDQMRVVEALPELHKWNAELEEKLGQSTTTPISFETGKEFEPQNTEGALHILVVDDKPSNLKRALELLGNRHYVTLAKGYADGRRLIAERSYEVVLSDSQMPLGFDAKTALSEDAIEVGSTVPCGPYLVFPATKKGAKVAIVTDANHHQDWTSALFDGLRQPQTINGQTVLFINNLGKAWDKALEALLAAG